MENTAADFWQMVWEQDVHIIVAATDDKETHVNFIWLLLIWRVIYEADCLTYKSNIKERLNCQCRYYLLIRRSFQL